jgi:ABC-type dipeptide transport system, periplasmic component
MTLPALSRTLRQAITLLAVALLSLAAAQTLRVATEIPAQLDPTFASSDAEILILSNVYDYLVELDAGNRLQPGLATSWTVSDDGTAWTFDLRSDVTFHGGASFGPEDVIATFDRLRDPEAELPTSDLYAGIDRIEATGPNQVTSTSPNPANP